MNLAEIREVLNTSLRAVTDDDYTVVVLPDDVNEAYKIVDNLKDELLVKKFVKFVSDVINKYKDEMISNYLKENPDEEVKIPHFFKLNFEEEWNDEGGTSPTISSLYLYDENGNYVEGEELFFRKEGRNWNTSLEEYLRDEIYSEFYIRELESLIEDDKLQLDIK